MIRLTRVRLCVILMALATLCLSAVSASAKEKEIDVKDLPQAVVDAAERTVPGGVIVEAEVETEKDGKTTEIEIDESGKVLEIEAGDDDDDEDDD